MEEGGRMLLFLAAVVAILAGAHSLPQNSPVKTGGKHVGCYFGAWAFYRPGDGKFDVDDIDPQLCTHIYYGFSNIDNQTWEMYPYDPWYDLNVDMDADYGCVPDPLNCNFDSYRRFVALKEQNPSLTVMLSVGGWNAGSGGFSMMASQADRRAIFIDSVIPYLQKFGFDGLDLDWEYPGTNPGSDPVNDKVHFTSLIQELSPRLKSEGLLLSMAATPDPIKADRAYELDLVIDYFDWINVMTYDYSGAWANFTGHNAPVFGRWEESFTGHPNKDFDVFDTLAYYVAHGAPKNKIVMGMPTYGRGWLLDDETHHDLYCPGYEGVPKMPYTRQLGIWGYNEVLQCFYNQTLNKELLAVCPECKPGEANWNIVRDGCYKAPYMHQGKIWMSFDDVESIRLKTEFLNWMGIAGAMIWSFETDDFGGLFNHQGYNGQTYPLLREINRVLDSGAILDSSDQLGHSSQNAGCGGKPEAPMCDWWGDPTIPTLSTINPGTTGTTPSNHDCVEVGCEYDDQMVAYPGNCHWYIHCMFDDNGVCTTEHFDCGEFVFDPNVGSCIWIELPGEDVLCQ